MITAEISERDRLQHASSQIEKMLPDLMPQPNVTELRRRPEWKQISREIALSRKSTAPDLWSTQILGEIDGMGGFHEAMAKLDIRSGREEEKVSRATSIFSRERTICAMSLTPEIQAGVQIALSKMIEKGTNPEEAGAKAQDIARSNAEREYKKDNVPEKIKGLEKDERALLSEFVQNGEYDQAIGEARKLPNPKKKSLASLLTQILSEKYSLPLGSLNEKQVALLLQELSPLDPKKKVWQQVEAALIQRLQTEVTDEQAVSHLRKREAARLAQLFLNQNPQALLVTAEEIQRMLELTKQTTVKTQRDTPGSHLSGHVDTRNRLEMPIAYDSFEHLCAAPRKVLCQVPERVKSPIDSARAMWAVLNNNRISQNGNETQLSETDQQAMFDKILVAVQEGRPLDVIFHWPMAKVPNPHKCASRGLPDAAEITGLHRLLDIEHTLKTIRPPHLLDPSMPAVKIHLINECTAFNFVPGWTPAYLESFEAEMLKMIELSGGHDVFTYRRMSNMLWGNQTNREAWLNFSSKRLGEYKQALAAGDETTRRKVATYIYTFITGLNPYDIVDGMLKPEDISGIYRQAKAIYLDRESTPTFTVPGQEDMFMKLSKRAQEVALHYLVTMESRHHVPSYQPLKEISLWPSTIDKNTSLIFHFIDPHSVVHPSHGHGVKTKSGHVVARHVLNIASEHAIDARRYVRVYDVFEKDRLLYFAEE